MHPSIFSLILILVSLPPYSTAIPPYRSSPLASSLRGSHAPQQTQVFEVTKPIKHSKSQPCSYHILQHDFGFTYTFPPAFAPYAPPSHCPSAFSTAVLEWSATCRGVQFDRIFGVWLGGVELLRSCTAEPTTDGVFWKVQKDVTRYSSLLRTNQTLAVYLGNLVDKTYTGVYHVNVTIHYYPPEESEGNGVKLGSLGSGYRDSADLILPISRNLPLNDGLWFEIQNSDDFQSKKVTIPKNVYRAVLEVYVSYHQNDEFWYTNPPNNLSGSSSGNGPFREVLVSLDGDLVGAVWPFTVIFTGGFNPSLWRPITGIGSFNLPTYDIEITPFLGRLLDGQAHEFGFSVNNSLNVWYIDANLHLWLDTNVKETKAQLLEHKAEPLTFSSRPNSTDLNSVFFTGATRSIFSNGWVSSSYGNITTSSIQSFDFHNFMTLGNSGDMQMVKQTIEFNTECFDWFTFFSFFAIV